MNFLTNKSCLVNFAPGKDVGVLTKVMVLAGVLKMSSTAC